MAINIISIKEQLYLLIVYLRIVYRDKIKILLNFYQILHTRNILLTYILNR